jgi:hypothetical protein
MQIHLKARLQSMERLREGNPAPSIAKELRNYLEFVSNHFAGWDEYFQAYTNMGDDHTTCAQLRRVVNGARDSRRTYYRGGMKTLRSLGNRAKESADRAWLNLTLDAIQSEGTLCITSSIRRADKVHTNLSKFQLVGI